MQIWVLDENPYKAVKPLTNRLVNKMLVEQLQLLSTYYRKNGICYDFMYKSIPQGKELIGFIEDNLVWNFYYLDALIKENFKRFGERANTYKSVEVANKFLDIFELENKYPGLTYISFRCKKEYPLYDKLNKKELSVEEGIKEYNEYYSWNIIKKLTSSINKTKESIKQDQYASIFDDIYKNMSLEEVVEQEEEIYDLDWYNPLFFQ